MASNTIGFAVILIAVLLGSVALTQSIAISIDEVTSSQSDQIEKSITVKNQNIDVTTDTPNPNEFSVSVNNTGSENVDAIDLTILFENTDASILNSFEFDGSTFTPQTVEINGEPVPDNTTVISPSQQLNITYSVSGGAEPSQVRVFTKAGVGDTS